MRELNGSGSSQELARISAIAIEQRDVEIIAQPNEVAFGIHFHQLRTEHVAIELANVPDPPAGPASTIDFRKRPWLW
jgi:hypothetical protein